MRPVKRTAFDSEWVRLAGAALRTRDILYWMLSTIPEDSKTELLRRIRGMAQQQAEDLRLALKHPRSEL